MVIMKKLYRPGFLKSIRWRLVIILIMITFALMTVVWVFLNFQVEKTFYNDFKETIARNYENLLEANEITPEMTMKEVSSILRSDPRLTGIVISRDKSFTIINKETGEIVDSSDPQYVDTDPQVRKAFENAIFRSENLVFVLSQPGHDAVGESQGYTRTAIGEFYDYVRVQELSDGDFVLYFKYSRARALEMLGSFNNVLFGIVLLAMFAAIVIGFILSSTITSPIYRIMHTAEKISEGDFGAISEVGSDDELGRLGNTFNFMSVRLKNTLTEISSEKNKMEAILNYMTDGVVTFNNCGEVIHSNPAARKILGAHSEGLTLNMLTEAFGIDLSLERINEFQSISEAQHKIKYRDKYLKVQFALFSGADSRVEGIITVLQDITEEQKLDNIRREFVANVSHELRTPLASVKSYTETLLDGAMGDSEIAGRFLNVINDETDRMATLVKDLLTLSQHDGGIKLNMEELKVSDLTVSCIDRLKLEAQQKRQEIKLNIKHPIPLVTGDRHRLEQVFMNIIGNAIKYTPEKGHINITIYHESDKVLACVEDNGIGIPEGDLSRIFERFYRVDKARSRQLGGTGLGLAIAKEITQLHGGDITVKSRLGKGTQIYIAIPVLKQVKRA